MSRHNRNFTQPPSQRPAHQQVATRPAAAEGEAEQDIQKVPSAATESQSQSDAQDADSDRYEAQLPVTETDAAPGEATDLPNITGDARVETVDDVGEDFSGFEDISTRSPRHVSAVASPPPMERAIQAPVVVQRSAAEQEAHDREMEPIVPRRTQLRNYVGGQWYNLIKGQEQFVPRVVANHFREKGLI